MVLLKVDRKLVVLLVLVGVNVEDQQVLLAPHGKRDFLAVEILELDIVYFMGQLEFLCVCQRCAEQHGEH